MKANVNGLMSVGQQQQRNESQLAIGRKQHEQKKLLDTYIKLFISENQTLTFMLRDFTKY